MSYVVYHIDSTVKLKTYTSEASAKRSTTCMNRNAKHTAAAGHYKDVDPETYAPYAYADELNYLTNVVHMKKVTNLISGKEIEIPSNTPSCCDPSTELYWSM